MSVFQKETTVPAGARTKKEKKVNVTTKLVLIVSNWGFVRDNKDFPSKVRCTPHDVAIGFKLASSQFRPTGAAGGTKTSTCPYDFDAHGATLPFPAFLSLIKDSAVTEDFLRKIRRRYEADTGLSALATRAGNKKSDESERGVAWQAGLRQKLVEQFPELSESFGVGPPPRASTRSDAQKTAKKPPAAKKAKAAPLAEEIFEDADASDVFGRDKKRGGPVTPAHSSSGSCSGSSDSEGDEEEEEVDDEGEEREEEEEKFSRPRVTTVGELTKALIAKGQKRRSEESGAGSDKSKKKKKVVAAAPDDQHGTSDDLLESDPLQIA